MAVETRARQRAAVATKKDASPTTTNDDNDNNNGKSKQAKDAKVNYDEGTNFVEGGLEANPYFFALIIAAPFLSLLFAYLTSPALAAAHPGLAQSPLQGMLVGCVTAPQACVTGVLAAGLSVQPTYEASIFILTFMGVALLLEFLPGSIECGPETATGHIPKYVDNGVLHCIVYTILFWAGSNLGVGNYYDFGIIYDVFPGSIAFLNLFGLAFCLFLTVKGIHFPSTQDSGSSGSFVEAEDSGERQ